MQAQGGCGGYQNVLHCFNIASTPWEVIAWLTVEKQVVILKQGCEGCSEQNCLTAFEETMARVEEFLGTERYAERVKIANAAELPPPTEMSRRELFSLFGQKAKNAAVMVIPDDGSVTIDGMLYRKLLSKRLKQEVERGGKQAYGWRTLRFTEQCWGCGICAKVCPNRAIAVVELEEKKYMAHALWKCQGCGICESVCLEKGLSGMGVEYVTNPMEPVITEITQSTCKLCGSPAKAGPEELCMECKMKNKTVFGGSYARS